MDSLQIYSFKETIKNYIKEQGMPAEVIRMCLAEIYREVEKSALEEVLKEAEERERNDKDKT